MTSFAVFAADSNIHYYDDAPEELFCSLCESYIGKYFFYPSNLKVKSLNKDFSYSYDGQLILSQKAKEYLEEHSSTEIKFHQVNTSPELFVPEVTKQVLFDSEKRKTRFIKHCEKCGNYESIVGSTPPFLKGDNDIDLMGVYWTDVFFGSGKEKHPLFIVGEKLGRELKKMFQEIDLDEVRI